MSSGSRSFEITTQRRYLQSVPFASTAQHARLPATSPDARGFLAKISKSLIALANTSQKSSRKSASN